MAAPPEAWLARYLAVRARAEAAILVAFFTLQTLVNTWVLVIDAERRSLGFEGWEILTWEATSNAVWLLLVPAIVWMVDARPLRWGLLLRHLPWHAAASLVVCVVHVSAMVALRKLVYAAHGSRYDFGPWFDGLFYEALKDVRSYAMLVALVLSYRLLLWRWQGEASWLSRADSPSAPTAAPAAAAAAAVDTPPGRILVKKLGKEFLLPVAEIEWVQACGNYVNLHRQQHDYPLRSTLAAFEQRAEAAAFVRVHRSYLVNLALVQVIEPTESGDARLRLRDGSTVPCSRTFLEALRQRLAGAPPATLPDLRRLS
jgi:hypothetical protein